jgi:plastocyanin
MRGFVFGIIIVAIIFLFVPITSYADTITIDIPVGTSVPGCESSNSCYSPFRTPVSVGDTVIWDNVDTAVHTVTSGSPADGPSGVFDSSMMYSGSSYKFKFESLGEYDYFCMFHPWMMGEIIVNNSSTTSSSNTSPKQNTPTITNDPNKLDWSIMFVTTTSKCYSNHEKVLNFYTSLTKQYLDKFGITNRAVYSECIIDDSMAGAINYLTKSSDLTIVIPDYLMSVNDRHTTGSLGHYGVWDVKTIVSQSETLSTENKNTGWTLSHELAHFALDWKGYENKIMGNAVHQVQKEYNYCKSEDTTLAFCSGIWDVIKAPSGKTIPVMSPNYVVKTAESMKPKQIPKQIQPTPTKIPKTDDYLTLLGLTTTKNGIKNNYNGYEGDRICLNYSLSDHKKTNYENFISVPYKWIQVSRQVLDTNGSPITGYSTKDYKLDSSGKTTICENLKLISSNYVQNGIRYKASFAGDDSHEKSNAPTPTFYFGKNPAIENQKKIENEKLENELDEINRKLKEQQKQSQLEREQMQKKIDDLEKNRQAGIAEKQQKMLQESKDQRQQQEITEHFEKMNAADEELKSIKERVEKTQKRMDNAYNTIKDAENYHTSEESKKIITNAWKNYEQKWNEFQKTKTWANEYDSKVKDMKNKHYEDQKGYLETLIPEMKQFKGTSFHKIDDSFYLIEKDVNNIKNQESNSCFLFWCW